MSGEARSPIGFGAGPIPMGEVLAYHAARDPDRPAVTFNAVSISRAELDARSNRRARQLAERGVGVGDVVTVSLPNGLETYETSFALWKLGATPNMVSAVLPDSELRAIVELARPKLVIGPDPSRLPGWNVAPAGETLDALISADALPRAIAPVWKIMTSGGSTGRPKLIVDKNPGVISPTTPRLLQIVDDVLLNPGPLYHNAPFAMSTSALFTGAHVVEMGKFDALRALELIARHRVGWVNFVPTMLHRIWRLPAAQREAFDLSSLRVVFHMASACPVWLKEKWIEWLGPERIFELYGGTEGQGLCVIGGEEWLQHRGSVGRVMPGSSMRVIGEDGTDCPPGEIGEIYFLPDAGRGSTYSYVGATAKAFGDWESLGDLGYLDGDGYLYLVDRRTDLILSGGANIYPAEVEAALDAHDDVVSSIAVGLPDPDLGQRVHAIVQLVDGAATRTDEATLRAFMEARLARYKVPRSFEFVTENLRDDAGKARRTRLRDERAAAMASDPVERDRSALQSGAATL